MDEIAAQSFPTVSVIMPVYNAEHYLRQAIDSLLAQTFTDFELLVIDNGSTDDSAAIIRSYTDSRIRLLTEPCKGLVPPLNKGIAAARGSYIARMDADDVSAPQRLAQQVAYLDAREHVVMVGTAAQVIDESGCATGDYMIARSHGRALYISLCGANPFVHGSVMMRKSMIELVGGYRPSFIIAEEYDLWLRLGEIGALASISEPLYQYRVYQDSTSNRLKSQTVRRYTMLAKQYALQRQLYGSDKLGYRMPHPVDDPSCVRLKHRPSTMTLSDWVLSTLYLRQLRMGAYLGMRAALSEPGALARAVCYAVSQVLTRAIAIVKPRC